MIRFSPATNPGVLLGVTLGLALVSAPEIARGQRGGRGAVPVETPRQAAPLDLTGYWVSIVTEDWRFRMVTPVKGDYMSVPLNDEARKIADAWDPAKDETTGNHCKAYGAAAVMRQPGRVHVTWQDDETLKIETDAGQQTRLLHFRASQPPAGEPQWQGYSAASWEVQGGARGLPAGQPGAGSLKVVTTSVRPGYLRKNGVPYSENARVTEYFDRFAGPNDEEWFVVTTVVSDPKYLNQDFVTTSHFRKEPDGARWSPRPCEAR